MKERRAPWRAIVSVSSALLTWISAWIDLYQVTTLFGSVFVVATALMVPPVWEAFQPYWSRLRWWLFPGLDLKDAGLSLLQEGEQPEVVTGFSITVENRTQKPITTLDGEATLLPIGDRLPLFASTPRSDPKPLGSAIHIAKEQSCYIDFRYGRCTEEGVDWRAFSSRVESIKIRLTANNRFYVFEIPKKLMVAQFERWKSLD